MSKLADLLGKAKSLLGITPQVRDATDAVVQDTYDHGLFDELLSEVPLLRDQLTKLEQDIDYAPDIMRDTLMQFWKGDPQVRPQKEMAESHLHAHGVATDVSRSNELEDARRYTQHDKYGATMATIGATDKVHEYARKHRDELAEAQREKEEAEEAERQAREDAEKAAEQAAQSPAAEEGFHGPPSPAQEALAEALADAAAKLEAAQQASQDASQQLQQQAQQMQAQLAQPVSQAVSETKDKLEEEAELFSAWGVGDGELKEMDFAERAALAQALTGNRMSDYMQLVGRFKMMASAQRVRKVEYGRDQVVGVELSGDLSRVVMTEFANLAMGDDDLAEMLELDFYRRMFEGQLLSREFEGTEKVGKGAIVCLVDSSGSMTAQVEGITREAWAKAMALAMLDTARRQKRQFVGINFSSRNQIGVHRFEPGKYDAMAAVAFAQEFFGGGTTFEEPLDRAIRILEEEFTGKGKQKGDVVLITDDACAVSPEWMGSYLKRKEKLAFRTFGIVIGTPNPGGTLAALSDNARGITEFVDPAAVRDIFQVI